MESNLSYMAFRPVNEGRVGVVRQWCAGIY